MESYGALLKKAREDQELSIEDVEAKTTITRQYIEGLENEKNDAFPGEPYMIGFLKLYADFLGLNSEDLLKLYNAKKIQESPIPVELLQKKKPKFLVPLIVTLSILLLAGVGVYLYFFVFKIPQKKVEIAKLAAETKKIHQYEFSGTTETHRMYKGDQILIPAQEGEGNIVLTVKNTLAALTIQTPAGDQRIDLGEERALDVDGDSTTDVILYLSDIDMNDENRGAQVRMLLQDESAISLSPITVASDTPEQSATPTPAPQTGNPRQKVIHESNRPYPFTLTISFRNTCLLRYRVDNKEKIENHYTANSSYIPLTAQNGIRLWVSNENAIRLQVTADTRNIDLDIGPDGHVQVEDIKWVQGSDGKYRIVVEEVD